MYVLAPAFPREYLAFRILKNYTLRSDNVAASIQADNDNVTAGLQLAVSAYYVDSATGSSYTSESATRAYDTTIPDSQEQGSKAFLVSPPTSVRTVDRNDTTSIASQSVGGSFGFPFSQPSASVYTTSFDLSNISMNWSPATKYLFGELSLPSAPTNNFTSRSNPAMVSLNTPMQSTFSGTGMKPQMANTTVSDTTTISASGPLFVEGAEPSLAMLPPPTPSAFSSFPNLRSPGLSRYFPSAGGSSSGN